MKELLRQLARYHYWANQILTERIMLLDPAQQEQTILSSFPSLYKTILHMWDSESVWWQRLKGAESVLLPSKTFNPGFKESVIGLLQQNQLWLEWANSCGKEDFKMFLSYDNSKGEHFEQPIFQMALHVFNHGTYHRGQLVTMLRQLGVEDIPGTDFILWTRKK
jgi:uncharacterized damage-inducible protein DinB